MIGIIGFGRFGKLAAANLAQDFEVVCYDKNPSAFTPGVAGIRPASLEAVCCQQVVILAVPVAILEPVLKEIAGLLKPGATVIDVCSVKLYPVALMQAILPDTVSILATHPMFGPDSAARSVSGKKIVLCRVRIAPAVYECITSYLASKEFVIIETTPEEHDRQTATSLSLTHFIGRGLQALEVTALSIDTETFNRLLQILAVVQNDTWQLFEDMHRFNPHAESRRQNFLDALQEIHRRLTKPSAVL